MTELYGRGKSIWQRVPEQQMRRRIVSFLLFLALFAGAVGIVMLGAYGYLFVTPVRLEEDCYGRGVDTDTIRQWEEREKESSQGILAVAGWRRLGREQVESVGVGRSQAAQMVGVYGAMELVLSAELVSGVYGLPAAKDSCVLSVDLADALFGGVDVVGEKICFRGEGETWEGSGKRELLVAGVIDVKGEYVLLYVEEGRMDGVAVRFASRFQARERMEEMLR